MRTITRSVLRPERNAISLAEKAYLALEEMIVTLKLEPGSVLTEGQLSGEVGVGRTPLREALQRLASQGLVQPLSRRGVAIADINIAEHLVLLETRRVLDRLVAAKAARRATPDQREILKAHGAAMARAAASHDLAAFMKFDHAADEVIESSCRNSFAARALAPLHTHCRRFWYMYQQNGDLKKSARFHAAVFQAIIEGNEAAADAAAGRLVDYLDDFARSALDF